MKAKTQNWLTLLQSGTFKTKTVRVLDFISKNNHTDIDAIRRQTGEAHQTITSILSGLMDAGLVKEVGQRKKDNIVFSVLNFVQSEEEREQLAMERNKYKYEQWIKRGLSDYRYYLSPKMLIELMKEAAKHNVEQAAAEVGKIYPSRQMEFF